LGRPAASRPSRGPRPPQMIAAWPITPAAVRFDVAKVRAMSRHPPDGASLFRRTVDEWSIQS
jgi:hypothetical protein